MAKYEDNPEEAEADIRRSSDGIWVAENAFEEAIERQEAIEAEMDTADDDAQDGLSQRHQALDSEIEGLRQDLSSAHEYHDNVVSSWGF